MSAVLRIRSAARRIDEALSGTADVTARAWRSCYTFSTADERRALLADLDAKPRVARAVVRQMVAAGETLTD